MTRNEINTLNEVAIRQAICPICRRPIGETPYGTIGWGKTTEKSFSGRQYVHTACVPKANIAKEAVGG